MCDRGGGREGKGKSLRTSKVQLQHKIKEDLRVQLGGTAAGTTADAISAAAPAALVHVQAAVLSLVDCGAQLASRQFDRDQLKAGF